MLFSGQNDQLQNDYYLVAIVEAKKPEIPVSDENCQRQSIRFKAQ